MFSHISKIYGKLRSDVKISLTVVMLISCLSIFLSAFFILKQYKIHDNQISSKAFTLARHLALNSIIPIMIQDSDIWDDPLLLSLLKNIQSEQEIIGAFITDKNGIIRTHTEQNKVYKTIDITSLSNSQIKEQWLSKSEKNTKRAIVPIVFARNYQSSGNYLLNYNDKNDLKLPQNFYSKIFYNSIPQPCGIACINDSTLVVVNSGEFGGIFLAKKGTTFVPSDVLVKIGDSFTLPSNIALHSNGMVYVATAFGGIYSISLKTKKAKPFREKEFSALGKYLAFNDIAIAPSYVGPNHVIPYDLAILCNAIGFPDYQLETLLWTINTKTGVLSSKLINMNAIEGSVRMAFGAEGRLYFHSINNQICYLDVNKEITPLFGLVPDYGDITVNPITGDVYFSQCQNGEIWRMPRDGGYIKMFASGLKGIQHIEFSPDGKTLFVSYDQTVIEIKGPFEQLVKDKPYQVIYNPDAQQLESHLGYAVVDISLENTNRAFYTEIIYIIVLVFVLTVLSIVGLLYLIKKTKFSFKNVLKDRGSVSGSESGYIYSVRSLNEIGIQFDELKTMLDRLRTSGMILSGNNEIDILINNQIDELLKKHHDIKESIEKLEKIYKSKDDFLSLVAHELRIPLNSILLSTEYLLNGKIKAVEKQTRFHITILNECKRLIRLVSDVLDLSKIEAGKMKFASEELPILQMITDILIEFRSIYESRGICIDYSNIPATISLVGDKDKITQVLENIISNAIKFSTEGGNISISLEVADGVGTVKIKDLGKGIPKEKIPFIFDKFNQLESIDNRQEGSGLGMSIAKSIIEGHGGKIWIESEFGKGTTVLFTLPLSNKDAISEQIPKQNVPYAVTSPNQMQKILRSMGILRKKILFSHGLILLIVLLYVAVVLASLFRPEFHIDATPKNNRTHIIAVIAVLPFKDLSQYKDQEYFCQGITDNIINSLIQVKTICVVSSISVNNLDNRMGIREIGRELHVQTVIDGSIQKSGNQYCITAQIVDVRTGNCVWGESYNIESSNIFQIQNDISTKIQKEVIRYCLTNNK
jgi:signal transduction histidine kinase/TolB-like protein